MPLYEYACDACGHRFELIQKFSDPLADTCPKCGGAVRKLMSSPAIQFKGSGFYITDYVRKDQGAASKGDEAKSENGKTDKAEKKSDATDKGAKTDTAAKSTATESSSSSSASSTSTASSSTKAS